MARKYLSNVDAAWLHMDDPTNLMIIAGFFEFSEPLDYDRLVATTELRLVARWRRFKQRVRESRLPLHGPFWEDDPHFNIENHIYRIGLPSPGNDSALKELIGKLSSTPLDRSKPLWEFHLIENLSGGGSFLVVRLHHAIADGIALMSVLMTLCDVEADAPWPESEAEEVHRQRGLRVRQLFHPTASVFATTKVVAEEGRMLLTQPAHLQNRLKLARGFATRLARLALLPPDKRTRFKGKLGRKKVVAWTGDLPMEDVKIIKTAFGVTVNDVLVAAVVGGLRRFLLEKGDSLAEDANIRAMVPVNLRPLEETPKLGNHFGLVVLSLPIGQKDLVDRIMSVKRRMDNLKHSSEAVVGYTLLEAMGMTPTEVERFAVAFFAMKSTMVLTNVPGPRKPLYFAGSRIERIMFWVPQSGRLGMGISIFSYASSVLVGVITDHGLVSDPESISSFIEQDFREMNALAEKIIADRVEEDNRSQRPAMPSTSSAINTISIESETPTASRPIRQKKETGVKASERCIAITKAGTRCKNQALPGTQYCRVHAHLAV
ncbi:MAG: wax ester/triacylglycerol synthase family O-acyltransferase [Clostridia bacterium]|nr:MAG: wax ester/triacylglycerol synthase family O-acyltransferase [Clostridia bacterium]